MQGIWFHQSLHGSSIFTWDIFKYSRIDYKINKHVDMVGCGDWPPYQCFFTIAARILISVTSVIWGLGGNLRKRKQRLSWVAKAWKYYWFLDIWLDSVDTRVMVNSSLAANRQSEQRQTLFSILLHQPSPLPGQLVLWNLLYLWFFLASSVFQLVSPISCPMSSLKRLKPSDREHASFPFLLPANRFWLTALRCLSPEFSSQR